MRLTVNIQNGVDPVDYPRLRDAAVRGVRNLVIAHLLARQDTARHRPGMPQSGYWGDAANATTVEKLFDELRRGDYIPESDGDGTEAGPEKALSPIAENTEPARLLE